MSVCPARAARHSGVRPEVSFTSAPFSTSNLTRALCPPAAAFDNGVQLEAFLELILAPLLSSSCTTASFPSSAAYNSSAWSQFASFGSTSAPWLNSSRTISLCPLAAASYNSVKLDLVFFKIITI